MAHRSAHDIQQGLGQTGRFGEVFVGLGLLILLGGIVELVVSRVVGGDFLFRYDHGITAFLYIIEGIGFTVFGAMIMLAGWGRHHANFEW